MRKVLWVVMVAVLLWSGWWFVATAGMLRGISYWFDARKLDGWQADVSDIEQRGFPFRLHAKLIAPQLADPTSGIAIKMDQVDITAPIYWPGFITLKLPQTPILLASPVARNDLTMVNAAAELRLHPGTKLEFQGINAGASSWQLDTDQGSLLSGDNVQFSVAQSAKSPEIYEIEANAVNVTPGDLWRAALVLPADWPRTFETFSAEMTVFFDRPWDRTASVMRAPQPVVISLHRAEAVWGAVRLFAIGDIVIDPLGVPDGSVQIKAENWLAMLDIAETSGTLNPAIRFQVEVLLGALAQKTGSTDDLEIEVTFIDGQMAVGPIPLGPAPKIVLQ